MNEMKQVFTILWVEDKPRVVSLNKKELEGFFDKNYKDFRLDVIEAKTGKDIEANLTKQNVDVVVTDYNLEENMNGLDVIKLIKKNGLLTDVLFYTAKKFDFNIDEIYQKADHYGFIEVSEGTKEVAEPLQKLIKKNLKRCEDIVFLRGMVISKIIDLELEVNVFLEKYFQIPEGDKKIHFHNFILENRFNSLAGKRKTIAKIIENNKIKDSFKGLLTQMEKLETDRNLLAHCRCKRDSKNKNILISMGEEETFDNGRICGILKKINSVSEQFDSLTKKFSKVS
jgi:CheY-like chemotaxis protein